MAVRIEAVGLSRNPVTVRESLIVSVTIVTHGYLGKSTNAGMKSYTNGQLRLRGGGESVPSHAQLTAYRHSALHGLTYQEIETMEV